MGRDFIKGLYPITHHDDANENDFLSDMESVLKGGARLIQYRDKTNPKKINAQRASALLDLCNFYQAKLIINDDLELCKNIGAHGVHLGQKDSGIIHAREFLGKEVIIGISCHNSVSLSQKAEQQGADYLALGRFFPSITKPEATAADISSINKVKKANTLPLVAIGGITLDNAPSLLNEGVDALAVINDIWSATDIEQQARQYSELF